MVKRIKFSNTSYGFTLIELLIVLAIIGILASIMVGSFNTARTKSLNASVKSYLWQVRTQAELYYANNGNSYNNLCSNPPVVVMIAGAISTGSDTGTVNSRCNSVSTEWAINSTLKSPEGTYVYWCVDSTGKSVGEPAELSGSTHCA